MMKKKTILFITTLSLILVVIILQTNKKQMISKITMAQLKEEAKSMTKEDVTEVQMLKVLSKKVDTSLITDYKEVKIEISSAINEYKSLLLEAKEIGNSNNIPISLLNEITEAETKIVTSTLNMQKIAKSIATKYKKGQI
jgi:hypothetical protein